MCIDEHEPGDLRRLGVIGGGTFLTRARTQTHSHSPLLAQVILGAALGVVGGATLFGLLFFLHRTWQKDKRKAKRLLIWLMHSEFQVRSAATSFGA